MRGVNDLVLHAVDHLGHQVTSSPGPGLGGAAGGAVTGSHVPREKQEQVLIPKGRREPLLPPSSRPGASEGNCSNVSFQFCMLMSFGLLCLTNGCLSSTLAPALFALAVAAGLMRVKHDGLIEF